MSINAYPLCWPEGWNRTPSHERKWGQFKGTFDKVRRELLKEVDQLVLGKDARGYRLAREVIILSTNVRLRNDGEPFSGDRPPADPGVALYFPRNGKTMCFACDKYDAVWKNMRAIEHTISALRGIERWGSSQMLERAFTGFVALPEKSWPDCWDVLDLKSEVILALPKMVAEEAIVHAYRCKAMTAHPDRGGSTDAFQALQEAKDNALAIVEGRSLAA